MSYSIELGEKGLLYKNKMEAFNAHVFEKYNKHLASEELIRLLSSLQKLRNLLE